jgi:TonB family protein
MESKHRTFWWVFGTHASVLFLLLFIPWVKSCYHPKPKEIVTYISVESAPAPVAVIQPAPKPEPKPAPKPEPKPAPKPEPKPEPKPISKPVPKPPPKITPPKTNQPPPAVKKTEWKAAPVQKQTVRTTQSGAPPRPALDLSGVKAALNSGPSSGTVSPFAWYYESVKQRMYAAWRQPAGTPVGLVATAMIRVEFSGAVSSRSLIRRSGDAEFDRSVQAAIDSVHQLPAPPADLPDRNITVEFVLSN